MYIYLYYKWRCWFFRVDNDDIWEVYVWVSDFVVYSEIYTSSRHITGNDSSRLGGDLRNLKLLKPNVLRDIYIQFKFCCILYILVDTSYFSLRIFCTTSTVGLNSFWCIFFDFLAFFSISIFEMGRTWGQMSSGTNMI